MHRGTMSRDWEQPFPCRLPTHTIHPHVGLGVRVDGWKREGSWLSWSFLMQVSGQRGSCLRLMWPPLSPCAQGLLMMLLTCCFSSRCLLSLKRLCRPALLLLFDHVRYCQCSGQHFWYFSVSGHKRKTIQMMCQMNTEPDSYCFRVWRRWPLKAIQ